MGAEIVVRRALAEMRAGEGKTVRAIGGGCVAEEHDAHSDALVPGLTLALALDQAGPIPCTLASPVQDVVWYFDVCHCTSLISINTGLYRIYPAAQA